METHIIAYVDKTVIKIKGLEIMGMKPFQIEEVLKEIVGRPIRVIGVTGDSIEMDVYGLEPEAILKSEEGIINAISTVEGISATDVARIDSAAKAIEIDVDKIPKGENYGCAKERWLNIDR